MQTWKAAYGIPLLFLLSAPAWARPTGIIGKSKTGCVTCHGTAVTPTVSVTLSGPGELQTGAEGNYSLTIQGGPLAGGGLNVSVEPVSAATLLAGTGTRIESGQLTHQSPRTSSGGQVVFNFKLKAGASAGNVTLYAAGNSVNLNGENTGDAFNITQKTIALKEPVVITDAGMEPPPQDAGVEPQADSGTGDPGTHPNNQPPLPVESDDDLEPNGVSSRSGGCNTTGGSILALAAGLFAAVLRTRRRRG